MSPWPWPSQTHDIHANAIKKGAKPNPQTILFFNSLITLYFNSNLPSSALSLFRSNSCPYAGTWTATISAFSHSPFVLHLFLSMLRSTLPNARTFSTLLKTCASLPTLASALCSHPSPSSSQPTPIPSSPSLSSHCTVKLEIWFVPGRS